MLERKKASPPHDDTSRSGLFGAPGTLPSDAQWTPLHDPTAARFWNAGIPPHAPAPSGSSVTLNVQAFDLGVYSVVPSGDDDRQGFHVPPFQSSSSSLSRALSPPEVSSCSSPHNFYAYPSPSHEQATTDGIAADPRESAQTYHSNDENYMEIDSAMNFHEIEMDNFAVRPYGEGSSPDSGGGSAPPPLPPTDPPSSLSPLCVVESSVPENPPVEAVPSPVQPDSQDPPPAPKTRKPSATHRASETNKPPPRLSSHLPATSESVIPLIRFF